MDARDISSQDQIVAWMRSLRHAAEQAYRKKGHLVRQHPRPDELISRYESRGNAAWMQSQSDQKTIATSQLPPPYPPCTRPMHELAPIHITDMRLETHHRGKRILVRVRTPAQRMTAVMAIVEDKQGTAVLLQLYHQPEEGAVPASQILQPDELYILKEPFFKCAVDGSYTLRVDHLGDIKRIEQSDALVPSKWKELVSISPDQNSNSIRIQGNDAVKRGHWAAAERLYTVAIVEASTMKEQELAYMNRSLANLKLGRAGKALADAEKASQLSSPPSEKCLFRKARALYEINEFANCQETLVRLLALYPNNQDAKVELKRATARRLEEQTGKYNFGAMYKQANQTPPLIDCASFSAPVEVRASSGRGRGLFLKQAVSAGQLLVCEKAFAYSYAGDDVQSGQTILMNVSTNTAVIGGQARLLTQLMQKQAHSPGALQLFSDLHHGDYPKQTVSEVDGYPVVDSFLVDRIRVLNAFGAPRASRDSFHNRKAKDATFKDNLPGFTTCGMWLLASRINHSCIGNCRRSFIGDMQIIRATQDLEADTELHFGYRAPKATDSYEDVQNGLKQYGFVCGCPLCDTKKQTTSAELLRRKELVAELARVMVKSQKYSMSKVTEVLARIEQTYGATTDGTLKLEVSEPYLALGLGLLEAGKPAQSVDFFVKGFEALGFRINADVSTKRSSVPSFEVQQWGFTTDAIVWGFYYVAMAYRALGAAKAWMSAKRYAGVAYAIVVGESETLCETFPELAE